MGLPQTSSHTKYNVKVTRFKGQAPLTAAEQREITRRYEAGATLEALMTDYRRGKPTIRKIIQDGGVAIRSRGYGKNREWTPEWRAAHRAGCGTPEFAQKSRENLLRRLPSMRGPATDSKIEQRLGNALMKAGIGFTTQSLLLERYRLDIELHQAPIVIEADGAQHTLRDQKAKDAVRDAALTAAGYRVFRFTGSEVNRDADACIERVINACGLLRDREPVFDVRTGFTGPSHPNWKGGKREFTCETCGDKFLAPPKHRTARHVYCNRQCAGVARRGQPLSAEIRAKISAGNTGQKRGPLSAETKARMGAAVSAALKGKSKTAEHNAKVSAALRGRPVSAETRAKISASLKRRNAKKDQVS